MAPSRHIHRLDESRLGLHSLLNQVGPGISIAPVVAVHVTDSPIHRRLRAGPMLSLRRVTRCLALPVTLMIQAGCLSLWIYKVLDTLQLPRDRRGVEAKEPPIVHAQTVTFACSVVIQALWGGMRPPFYVGVHFLSAEVARKILHAGSYPALSPRGCRSGRHGSPSSRSRLAKPRCSGPLQLLPRYRNRRREANISAAGRISRYGRNFSASLIST